MRLRCLALHTLAAALALGAAAQSPTALSLTGDFWGTHDPSAAEEHGTWYVFATGKAPGGGQFAIRCSDDLKAWRLCGQVFGAIPDWIQRESPGTKELWAPDISYDKGEWRLFYAYSLFGKNTSGIALATNKTLDPNSPDYRWIDKGLVLRSTAADDYNAIDPNFITDAEGRSWLAFGSFWSGIKLRRLNDEGKPSGEDTKFYALATRVHPSDALPARPGLPADWQSVEAPFIVRHGSYYYLFVSWDLCCRGAQSTYRTVVGRSSAITGPYLDDKGVSMANGGGTVLLSGNSAWAGPGGGSVARNDPHTSATVPDILVFHAYDRATGKPALQVSTLDWSGGWPHAALGTSHGPAPSDTHHGPQAP